MSVKVGMNWPIKGKHRLMKMGWRGGGTYIRKSVYTLKHLLLI